MTSQGSRNKPNEWNLYLGKSFDDSLAAKGAAETFETLRYTFKPESVKNKPGKLWKETRKENAKGSSAKVYVELAAGDGQDSTSHTFEGQCTSKDGLDCVLILDPSTGRARLECLAGSTRFDRLFCRTFLSHLTTVAG
jgi:hypothetical protein